MRATIPAKPTRRRLDQLIVERGLAGTRTEAARLILAGRVRLEGETADKAGRPVRVDAAVELVAASPYVGRGGEKLAAALMALAVVPRDRVCLDVGASTGGFTDCLLKLGARRVFAVDVGRGQLHPRLRADARVTVIEGTNARYLEPARFDEAPSLATIDVSFISLTKVLPAVAACLGVDASSRHPQVAGPRRGVVGHPQGGYPPLEIVALVKPQFEVGRGQVGKGGVVRDRRRHAEVLTRLAAFTASQGLAPRGVVASPLRGAKGNREFFLHLATGGAAAEEGNVRAAIEAAVEADRKL